MSYKRNEANDSLALSLCKEFEQAKAGRANWDMHWDELSKYVLPTKDDVYGGRASGDKRGNDLFDTTAIHSNELLASALHSMLTNPNTMWMWMTTGDLDIDMNDDVRQWVSKAVSKMHFVLNNSNFQPEVHELYLDEGCFGTGFMVTMEDDTDVIRFQTRAIYEAYLSENNKGLIDIIRRTFKWTARQILEEWGEDTLPSEFVQRAKLNPEEQFDILHVVKPRKNGKAYNRAKSLKQAKIAEFYVLIHCKHLLEESGYWEMPMMTPRWSKISGEVYGRSPAMKCLPEIKMGNEQRKAMLQADQLNIAPPLAVPDDGYVLPIQLKPFGFTFYRGGTSDKIEPLLQNIRLNMSLENVNDTRERIRQAFFIDQLQLRDGPQMTATEVLQRTEENLRILSPILGRQYIEFLKPLTERLFNIMVRRGMFEEAPAILKKRKVEFVFSSAIAQAQLVAEAQKIQRALAAISGIAQAQPQIIDYINGDNAIKYIFNAFGVPQSIINDNKDVKVVRDARAQAQQKQMQMMEQQHEAQVVQQTTPAAALTQE